MRLDDLKELFIDDQVRNINITTFDINYYSNLMEILSGKREFVLDGELYKFTEGFKRNDDDVEENFGLSEDEVTEIITTIYEELDENKKDEYLDEMLRNSTKNPYKATQYFEAEKAKRNSGPTGGTSDNESSDSGDSSNDASEDNDYSDDYDDTIDTPELPEELPEEIQELEETDELNFEHDGPAIAQYKNETLRLEEQLAELENQLGSKDNTQPENTELNNTSLEQANYIDLFETLKESYYTNRQIRTELNNNYGTNLKTDTFKTYEDFLNKATLVNNLTKEITDKEKEIESLDNNIKVQKEELEKLEQQNIKNDTTMMLRKGIYEREKEKRDLEAEVSSLKYKREIAQKSALHQDINSIRDICIEEIQELSETVNAITQLRNNYRNNNDHIPFELQTEDSIDQNMPGKGTYTSQLNAIRNKISQQMIMLDNKDNTKDDNTFNFNPQNITQGLNENEELKKQIDDLKQQIKERKQNEELYYSCLDDIKKLKDDIQNGLDPESEEVAKRIEDINNKKSPLPEPLKNELAEYLKLALGKKPEKIDSVEKNPKKTWKTYVALAAGIGLGVWGGFALTGAAAIIVPAVAGLANAVVGKLRVEARNRRINGVKVESIEEPSGKLRKAVHNLKEKILEHEDVLRDINWFLTAGLVSYGATKAIRSIANTIELQKSVNINKPDNIVANTNPTPDPSNTIPNVGDKVNGLEYGYNNSLDAANQVNPAHLNQAILNDGNTVVAGYRVGGQTVTSLPSGVTPDAVLLTDGTENGYRAWAAVEDVVNTVGRSR